MKAVNLLPSDQPNAPKAPKSSGAKASASGGSSFGAFVLIGALAFAVVGLAAYVLTNNTIKDRQAELARVNAELKSVQAATAALKPYADFQTLATNRVATVVGLAGARFDWEKALGDVSRAMPRDVHLKSLRGSVTNGVGAAGGSSGVRSAVQSPAIEISGCTSGQTGVAKLMSRLRAVRGVTRVSLAKADKDANGPGVQTANPQQGSLCGGKGQPPAFDLVMFFERAAVAPAAAPNTAAPAGATPPTAVQQGAKAATQPPADPGAAPAQTQPTTPGAQAPATQGVSSK